jgi:hypothetical protein
MLPGHDHRERVNAEMPEKQMKMLSMIDPDLQKEAEEMIRKAQAQPGIADLMRAYGRYDEVMEQSRAYLERRR